MTPLAEPPRALRFTAAIVRGWTRFYTWGMPPSLRDGRRAEIESDLWEFQQDTASGHDRLTPAAHMLARLLLGIPHDLCWRVEHVDARDRRSARIVVTSAVAIVLTLAALWVLPLLQTQTLPKPPRQAVFMPAPPPPPPPPPPPARP